MSKLDTALSVRQIQLALRDSGIFDKRSDIVVPNVSWGLLPYEADLLAVSRSGQVTEVEIKRSLADLKADFRKRHRHDSAYVTYFYYCVPDSLAEKAKKVIFEHEQSLVAVPIDESRCPALLSYSDDGRISDTGFGTAKRSGFHKAEIRDVATLGRLASLRYWNLLEECIRPEDRGALKRSREMQDENRTLKLLLKDCEEDFDLLKRFLRKKHPDVWKEYINGADTDRASCPAAEAGDAPD